MYIVNKCKKTPPKRKCVYLKCYSQTKIIPKTAMTLSLIFSCLIQDEQITGWKTQRRQSFLMKGVTANRL